MRSSLMFPVQFETNAARSPFRQTDRRSGCSFRSSLDCSTVYDLDGDRRTESIVLNGVLRAFGKEVVGFQDALKTSDHQKCTRALDVFVNPLNVCLPSRKQRVKKLQPSAI